jgi:hypothetical protein
MMSIGRKPDALFLFIKCLMQLIQFDAKIDSNRRGNKNDSLRFLWRENEVVKFKNP